MHDLMTTLLLAMNSVYIGNRTSLVFLLKKSVAVGL